MDCAAKGAENFLSIENGQFFFSPNVWQNDVFMNHVDALIPKIPFSFFAELWVRVTSGAQGSVSVGFWGTRHLSLFLGEGGCIPPPLSPS